MQAEFIIEAEDMINGFKIVTKKPKLCDYEYKKTEYLIVTNILKVLSDLNSK